MGLDITFLGHAGFLLAAEGHAVAIDPFLTGNPVARHRASDIHCDHVVLTHGHADHIGDAAAIATANGATVTAAFEICEYLGARGVANTNPANPGGRVDTDFGWIALTQAFHSSSFEGAYMGMACGVVLHLGGVTFYHCGDTALFSDMRLLGEIYRPDVAAVPIGDRFTMGPELAGRAADLIAPSVAIPIHYNTWPLVAQDPATFRPAHVKVKVLAPGETWRFES